MADDQQETPVTTIIKNFALLWLVLSLVWCALTYILLISARLTYVNYSAFWIYFASGPIAIAIVLALLTWVHADLFESLHKTAPIGTVFIAVFALFGYLITAERNSQRAFLDKQLETCVKISETLGILATESGLPWEKAYKKFWSDYLGPLGVFEDDTLETKIVKFKDLLSFKLQHETHYPLYDYVFCIAHVCRVQTQASWSVMPGIVRPDLFVKADHYCKRLDDDFTNFCKSENHPAENRSGATYPECGETMATK
jgi:hypothetical protein